MALYESISEENREVDQGNSWDFSTKLIGKYVVNPGNVTHYQWRCSVELTKTYKYVGLTKEAAETCAATIGNAYKKTRTKTVTRWIAAERKWVVEHVTNVEVVNAIATPQHAEGPLWNVCVDVSASTNTVLDKTSGNNPTISELQALLADVADYPELETDDETVAEGD